MPILPAEPDLYPADLWDRDGDLPGNGEARWWCLHTRPRQEKSVARDLLARRVPFYLPQFARETRTPAGRKVRSVVPLFVGYLFLRGDEPQRVEALRGNRLVGVLPVPDQEGLARDLRQVHRMLASDLPVVPESTYPVGARVRIITGPLAGLVGVVDRRDRGDRLAVLVHFLGRGASVELRDWQLEPADEA